MEYKREIEKKVEKSLFGGKIIIIYGPRQVGKTTFVKNLLNKHKGSYFSCEEPDVSLAFNNKTSTEMWSFLGNSKIIVLDEAQKINNIGNVLKLLHDSRPEIQIIATGSSSFDLANKINEPLTGRNWEFYLYSLSASELVENFGEIETRRLFGERLVFGSYPEIIANSDFKQRNLSKITNDYLYKDLLAYDGLRKSIVLQKLLQLLAFKVCGQVSYNELSKNLSVSRQTVMSYIDLLEQAFVVFRLYPFSTNQRNEIKKMPKIYFYDNGIRNIIIQNLNPVDLRDDVGQLFENYFISEKIKQRKYKEELNQVYFWRSKDGQEIDFIESYQGSKILKTYECKYSKNIAKVPPAFEKKYKNSEFNLVNKENILKFFAL